MGNGKDGRNALADSPDTRTHRPARVSVLTPTCATTQCSTAASWKSGSEREFVELPNWRALGMAAAPETDAEASARSVAGQTVERTDSRLYHRRCRWSCGQARWIDPALT